MPELATLIERSAAFHRERATEYFLALTGQKDRLEAAGISRAYPELFSPDTLDYIAGLSDADAPERLRRALLRQFTDYRLGDALRMAQEALTNAEGAATLDFDGAEVNYRSVPGLLSSEADADKRARLCAAWLAVLDSLNPQRSELKQLEAQSLRELGYADAADHARLLLGLRLEPLHTRLQLMLERTEQIYRARLERYAQEAGLDSARGAAQLAYSDLNYVMAGRQYDALFPPTLKLPALERTLAGLGIELERPGITLDLEARPRKTPRAFCISPDAPRDVRLVLTPRGGQEDYATLFHEAGHMLFSSHMDPGLPFVYRHHGDTSVHESYAFLFQHLTESPAWWYEVMGVKRLDAPPELAPLGSPTLRDCLAFMRFDRLYMLRRYSAKLGYELGFHAAGGLDAAGGPAARAAQYSAALTTATGFAYPAVRYLDDFDQSFYVAQYLQAWVWEVQLRRWLEQQFGDTWFMQRRAGDFLRELWVQGMQFDIWEIAERLGFGSPDEGGGLNADLIEAELLGKAGG
jgi:hypothetical protein